MPIHPWELRADANPLELAATRWMDTAALLARRSDELIDSARRATEGWDATAAETYAEHRRQVLGGLDRFTALAVQVATSLRAVSALLAAAQKELDQSWAHVVVVPHEVVGESRHLVFHPSADDDRGMVTRGEAEAAEIRSRLSLALDQESVRLHIARTELVTVRTELMTLAGGRFAHFLPPATAVGVSALAPPSTSAPGSPQAGVSALPPTAPIGASMPELGGLASAGVASLASAATAAGRLAGGRDPRRTSSSVPPPMGAVAAGAMGGARGATTSRGTAGARPAPIRVATPRAAGGPQGEQARGAGGKDGAVTTARDAEREATRSAGRPRVRLRDRRAGPVAAPVD